MANKWFGSLQNRMLESTKQQIPVVGMGATEISYSDRTPYEIIDVKDNRHITVRRLDYKRIDSNGMSECQEYEYYSNEHNAPCKLFLTKQGRWRERYPDGRLGCDSFYIGYAERYYDFSF